MQFNSILDILKKAQEKYPSFSLRLAEAEALGRWDIAVGEIIAKHARAVRVIDSILWVEVEHPIWRAELHYRKQQILDILNGQKQEQGKKHAILKDIQYIEPRKTKPALRKWV